MLVLVLAIAAFAVLRPAIIEPGNIATILRSACLTTIMVLGVTWVCAAGKMDVCFMQVGAIANMVAAGLVVGGYGWTVAGIAGLVCGAGVGLINGVLIGILRLPPLITTIATGGICASAAAAVGKGTSIRIGDTGNIGQFLAASLGPIPLIAIVTAIICVIAWYCQEHLTFGRYVYATAQNEEAVLEAGVSTGRLIIILYVLAGITASAAGVLVAASLSSGQPFIGASYFIDELTAVLVGGMMIRLGQPNIIGTVTAALLLAVLVSGGALMGWPDYVRDIVKGLLLIFGVAAAVYMGRRSRLDRKRA